SREGLIRTPERVEKSYEFLTSGYKQDPEKIINSAIFEEKYDDMIIVKDIEVFSLCEHHLLPFFGRCHVAYIPNGKIVGLSKIPRLVDVFAKRLQVQERLTHQIAHTLYTVLKPRGVGVIIEAKHMCMVMRGVEKQNSIATTSSMLGVFRNDLSTRQEFLRLVQRASL
ncbi:MAG: GTP cyclohydrolase I FolE, partial [bacterium]